jgi:hypothetical protein
MINAYVTAATFTRPRNHYLAIARAVIKTVVKCDGVPPGAKLRFQRKMMVVQRIFKLMYRAHEFRVSHAIKSDMYTFLNRANWTQVVSCRRRLCLSRCFLLAYYKPENYFNTTGGDTILARLTAVLPYDTWWIIYGFV